MISLIFLGWKKYIQSLIPRNDGTWVRPSRIISRTDYCGTICKSSSASVLSNSILFDAEEVVAKRKAVALPQPEGFVKLSKGLVMFFNFQSCSDLITSVSKLGDELWLVRFNTPHWVTPKYQQLYPPGIFGKAIDSPDNYMTVLFFPIPISVSVIPEEHSVLLTGQRRMASCSTVMSLIELVQKYFELKASGHEALVECLQQICFSSLVSFLVLLCP